MLCCSIIQQNPYLGAFWGVPYVIVRQNHSIPDVLSKLAQRTEHTHSILLGHAAVVVPMFRALIMIASVDRHGRVALRSEILSMPIFHLFDFFDISKCSHCFRLQAQKKHWCDRPFLAKNNSFPPWMIQSRRIRAPSNWNYALKLKIDTQKINWGIEDGIKSLSWNFELNRTRNRFFLNQTKFWNKITECTVLPFFLKTKKWSIIA